MSVRRTYLSPVRILEMNLGFLGLQFSFGLQQANMAPIYSYLGASEAALPMLQMAGPVTGLIVQPLVGALSDRTAGRWGRRTPYMLVGALICSACLVAMPLSSSVLMAASLLWLLDAGNNMTMEPYRAWIADRLDRTQAGFGFLAQAGFTGLAQMMAFLSPSLLVVAGMNQDWVDAHRIPYTARAAFMIGAVLSAATMAWSIWRMGEAPAHRRVDQGTTLGAIVLAARTMPRRMRRLALMNLFQWFAMMGYWTYVVYALARSIWHTADPHSSAFHSAVLGNGAMAAFYNLVACAGAFAMVPLARRFGPGLVHALALAAGGCGMIALPLIGAKAMLALPAIGIGLAWGSMMGNPHALLAPSIPPGRNGVTMGLFNATIVLPMLLFAVMMSRLDLGGVHLGLDLYRRLLGGDPGAMLRLSGMCLIAAGILALWAERTTFAAKPVGEMADS